MRKDTDCEVAMIATACGVSYETACKAIGWKDLPSELENPIYGNPYNVYCALLKLGFWKQNINWKQLQNDGEICVLIHYPKNPIMMQHWIVRHHVDKDLNHYCYFGKSDDFTVITNSEMKKLFLSGYPNCAFKVYKCNIFKRIILWIKNEIDKLIIEVN